MLIIIISQVDAVVDVITNNLWAVVFEALLFYHFRRKGIPEQAWK